MKLLSVEPISNQIPINTKLNQPIQEKDQDPVAQLWKIDGQIKVYLKYVGRVPYLHIDSNLDYRRPLPIKDNVSKLLSSQEDSTNKIVDQVIPQQGYYLQSANFNQLRRVISKQVHYFDHPLFGMIVRLHRFDWPIEEETEEDKTDSDQS